MALMCFIPILAKSRSDDTGDIACWFVDTDYNEESFFARHAYFLGANDPYKSPQDYPQIRNQSGSLGHSQKRHIPAF